jgi:hypothetical protein
MNPTSVGWTLFIAAVGMMCSLLSVDVTKLGAWSEVYKPEFIGLVMAHLGAVITAFIGGKLIPADRNPAMRTRQSDGDANAAKKD